MNIRVTKEFNFEMAHALFAYDGPCKNIHGHSYQLAITVKGKPIRDTSNIKQGMVIDFSVIKDIVSKVIIEKYDHALVLNKADANLFSELRNHKLIITDYQPTCENLLIDFVNQVKIEIPKNIHLQYVKLRETGTSYAEWHSEDN